MDDKPDITRRQFIQGSLAGASLLVPGEVLAERARGEHLTPVAENATGDPQDTSSVVLENELIRIDLNAKTVDIQGLLQPANRSSARVVGTLPVGKGKGVDYISSPRTKSSSRHPNSRPRW